MRAADVRGISHLKGVLIFGSDSLFFLWKTCPLVCVCASASAGISTGEREIGFLVSDHSNSVHI